MPISAGVSIPFPTRSELVFPPSFPFNKSFWVENAIWYSALELEVWTSYEAYGSLATVSVNNQKIGEIPPRSTPQNGNELAPVSIHFANGVLHMNQEGRRTGANTLQIVPPTSDAWLVVGNWRIHYYQSLP